MSIQNELYFAPLPQLQVNDPVVRARFVYVNNKGQTLDPSQAINQVPLGITYFTEIPTAYKGWWIFYNPMGSTSPVWLELGQPCETGNLLTSDSRGRGILGNAQQSQTYAQALQAGNVGDYIRVLPFLSKSLRQFNDAFSNAFK